jgi:hypothetical protein
MRHWPQMALDSVIRSLGNAYNDVKIITTRFYTFCFTQRARRGFIYTVFLLLISELLVALTDFTQNHSDYSLFPHTWRVVFLLLRMVHLLLYYFFHIRGTLSFTAGTNQHFDGSASPLSSPPIFDSSGFERAIQLESGELLAASASPTFAPVVSSLALHAVDSGFTSPAPLDKAHIRPACTNASRVAVDFANGSTAPPSSPEVFDEVDLSETSIGYDMQELESRHKCRSNRTASASLPSRREFHRTAPSFRPFSASENAEVPSSWHGLNPTTVGGAFEGIATLEYDTNF